MNKTNSFIRNKIVCPDYCLYSAEPHSPNWLLRTADRQQAWPPALSAGCEMLTVCWLLTPGWLLSADGCLQLTAGYWLLSAAGCRQLAAEWKLPQIENKLNIINQKIKVRLCGSNNKHWARLTQAHSSKQVGALPAGRRTLRKQPSKQKRTLCASIPASSACGRRSSQWPRRTFCSSHFILVYVYFCIISILLLDWLCLVSVCVMLTSAYLIPFHIISIL